MRLVIAPNGYLQIDDARIIHRNLRGEGSKFNAEGKRNFSVVIPNEEIAQMLINDVNEYGVGWNVKVRPPQEEGDEPFMFLPVKIRFNDRGPNIHLQSGDNRILLTEDTVSIIDRIWIQSVSMDIRPYDDMFGDKPFRSAYLQSMLVIQDIRDRFAEEEHPEE